MAILAGSLSNEQRRIYVEGRLKPGVILFVYCNFQNDPHNKFLVLISAVENLAFLINSEIAPFIALKPPEQQHQVLLRKKDYTFLDYDSYLNCFGVFKDFEKEDLINELCEDTERMVGELNETTKAEIIAEITRAKDITGNDKLIIHRAFGIT
jgi:hypothetical protein